MTIVPIRCGRKTAAAAWIAVGMAANPVAAQTGQTALGIFSPPETPAAALLGLEPHLVQRPGITTDFVTSLISATNGLSVLPESYAVAFAPYWVFGAGHAVPFHEFIRNEDVGTNIAQSLMVSLAATAESDGAPDGNGTALSMGFQFSLRRGSVSNDVVRRLAVSLQAAALGAESAIDSLLNADPRYRALEARIEAATDPSEIPPLAQELERLRAGAAALVTQSMRNASALRDNVRDLWAERTGWVVDVAGGAVIDFADRTFNTGRLSRWGLWVTGGYEASAISMLGVARFLGNDLPRTEPNAIDLGGRVSLTGSERFALSAEVAWRRYPNSPPTSVAPGRLFDDEWRAVLNVEFALARGKTVAFAFGQDFDANTARDDLIAFVRFLVGFGTTRVPSAGSVN